MTSGPANEVLVPDANPQKLRYCGCPLGDEAWSISGWHFCYLTAHLADRIAAGRHPHDTTARAEYREHLGRYIGVTDIAYERCPPYVEARKRRALAEGFKDNREAHS